MPQFRCPSRLCARQLKILSVWVLASITFYSLLLTPHSLLLTPYSLRLTPYALRLTPYALRLTPYALLLTLYSLLLTPYSLLLTPYSLLLTPYFISTFPQVPLLLSPDSTARLGGVLGGSSLVEALGPRLVSYAVLLVVPLLRCMSDPSPPVSRICILVCTHLFA